MCGNGLKSCGNGSINWFFSVPTIDLSPSYLYNSLSSQAAEKYDSKVFIRSKIMGNREDYEKKLQVITTIGNDQIKTPHHIPVEVYIQEAKTLYYWAQEDKEALTFVGLSWELVEDLPIRIGALIQAEASWYLRRNTGNEAAEKWANQSPLAYDLKKQLMKVFFYAFRKHPDLLAALRNIGKGKGHASMIQGLNDLVALGEGNAELLEAVRFDMMLLDKADQTSDEMAALLAEVTTYRNTANKAKKIRDQAYTHLKEAVDEIFRCGQFVFRDNKERFRGYRSEHLRGKYLKRKREGRAKEKPEPAGPGPKS